MGNRLRWMCVLCHGENLEKRRDYAGTVMKLSSLKKHAEQRSHIQAMNRFCRAAGYGNLVEPIHAPST